VLTLLLRRLVRHRITDHDRHYIEAQKRPTQTAKTVPERTPRCAPSEARMHFAIWSSSGALASRGRVQRSSWSRSGSMTAQTAPANGAGYPLTGRIVRSNDPQGTGLARPFRIMRGVDESCMPRYAHWFISVTLLSDSLFWTSRYL
jgi:hypothetical protein